MIETLKEVREALQVMLVQFTKTPSTLQDTEARGTAHKAITKLDALISAQEKAEPVAWALTEELTKRETTTRAHLWFSNPLNCMWTPLFTAPQPAPSTSPLTDEWIEAIVQKEMAPAWATMKTFARAIEAAHGIGAKP